MNIFLRNGRLAMLLFTLFTSNKLPAQDTLRVMSYNVLGYGSPCQGANATMHGYFKTIIEYAQPDILGIVKTASIKQTPTDIYGIAPYGFADSIKANALNIATPGKYEVALFTNTAYADVISILFYNQEKLGYLSTTLAGNYITDFDLYKLYYKDTALAQTHDTTFLYVVLNHTQSGNDATQRNTQIATEMQQISTRFSHLPNMINMGDFNTHSSTEGCYQTLTNPADTNFRFYDTPFYPDAKLLYPANWDASPSGFTSYLTTSTRSSATVPNTCGTGGGAKSWYDHIFISPWILHNSNYISYVANSYTTIGNDGNRLGISVNDNTNTAVPSVVANALFQMSNKYPVMVKLTVTANTTGNSLPDPQYPTGINTTIKEAQNITIPNPVSESILLRFAAALTGKPILLYCYDVNGKLQMSKQFTANSEILLPVDQLPQGSYFLKICADNQVILRKTIIKI